MTSSVLGGAPHPLDRGGRVMGSSAQVGVQPNGQVEQVAAWTDPGAGPAEQQTHRVIDEYAVTVRGLAGVCAAIIGMSATPVSSWQRPICLAVLLWSLVRLLRRKQSPGVLWVGMDLVIACAAGLTAPLTTTPGDVATLRGFAVNVANPGALTFAWLPRRGEAATLCAAVIGCYLIGGSMTTGASAWASSAIYLLPIQSALSWVLVGMFVPAARSADAAASARVSTTIEHDVATTRRAAEREHWAMLHDTAASTLLMVGEGVPITANGRIRLQAERDVNAIRRPSGGHPPAPADLADAIRRQIEESPVQVDLQVAGRPIVPAVVLDATLGAVRELLTNVERHSGTLAAAVTLTDTPSGFELLVHDDGFGFDCVEVGRGLRESVIGRMRRAGATVLIESTAHSGTDVRVRWSDS